MIYVSKIFHEITPAQSFEIVLNNFFFFKEKSCSWFLAVTVTISCKLKLFFHALNSLSHLSN